MIGAFHYWFMQSLGYRKYYYDHAFLRSIPLTSYEGWLWRLKQEKGTYREVAAGYKFAGYGVDK